MHYNPGQRAAIYTRISDDREGRELGVTRQEEDCRLLADSKRLKVVGLYVDNDISASTRSRKKRPEYQRMLADARAGLFDYVLAYTTNRITRKPRENEDLIELAEQYGIRYEYVRSPSFDLNSAHGRLIARVLAATDAGEAEATSERVARAAAQRAQAGKFHGGGRPYGYEADGITIRESEARVLKDIVARLIAGESQVSVIRHLNSNGIPTADGNKWTLGNLKRTLLKKRYIGVREHTTGDYKAEWPAILSPTEYELMTSRFQLTAQPWEKSRPTGRRYLLSGITICGTCGAHMYGQARQRENGRVQRRYRCKGLDNHAQIVGCGKVFRDAAALDEFVSECVLARFDSPEIAAALTPERETGKADELVAELDRLNIRRRQLAAQHALREIEDYDIMRATIMAEIQRVEGELGKMQHADVRVLMPKDQPLRRAWDKAAMEWRRDIIKLVVDNIKVLPGHPGSKTWNGHRFDADLVQISWKV